MFLSVFLGLYSLGYEARTIVRGARMEDVGIADDPWL
jgi:hypothetical protein